MTWREWAGRAQERPASADEPARHSFGFASGRTGAGTLGEVGVRERLRRRPVIGALGENARRRHVGHDDFQLVAPGGEHLARRFGHELRRVATVALGAALAVAAEHRHAAHALGGEPRQKRLVHAPRADHGRRGTGHQQIAQGRLHLAAGNDHLVTARGAQAGGLQLGVRRSQRLQGARGGHRGAGAAADALGGIDHQLAVFQGKAP